MEVRDIVIKHQKQQDKKQDVRGRYRAVLTDAEGNQTSTDPQVDVWANQTTRRVWHMPLGATQPSQVFCQNISNPYVGLPVECGYEESNNTIEVLRVDQLPAKYGESPIGWDQNDPASFEPGGLKMMWLYSKALIPLATWPDATGLTVNINAGDYPYSGSRKTFTGQTGYALAAPAGAGTHYYAGLYLDAANTLQVVYGTAVTTSSTPPEPAWPAGAFRLSVVRIANGQTSIEFGSDSSADNDVFDRRMLWSDEDSGGSGGGNAWPLAGENLLEAVNYASVALLLAAMSSGDIGYLGARSSSEAVDVNVADVTLQGVGRLATVFTDAFLVSLVTALTTIEDIGVDVDGSGTAAIRITDGTVDLIHVRAEHTGVANARAFQLEAAARLYNCEGIADNTGAGTSRAVYVTNSAVVEIHGGNFTATTGTADEIFVDAGASALLNGPTLTFGNFGGAGDVFGWWLDSLGNVHIVPGTDLNFGSGSGRTLGAWLEDVSTGLRTYYSTITAAITAAASGDIIHLEAGTYTGAVTLNKDITLKGSAQGDTILTQSAGGSTLTITAAGAAAQDLTVINTRATGTNIAVNVDANARLRNVIAQSTGAGSTGIGIDISAATVDLIGCEALGSGATSKIGMNLTSSAVVNVYGGVYNGATYDILLDTSTVNLFNPVLANNILLAVTSTVRGGYFDAVGLDYPRSAFAAHKNGTNQTGVVTSTFTKLTATTELFDAAGDYDAANSKHTPLTAGYYFYTATIRWESYTDVTPLVLSIYLNGAEYKRGGFVSSGTGVQFCNVSAFVPMNGTTDYVEFYVFQNTGSDRVVTGLTAFTHIQGALLFRS